MFHRSGKQWTFSASFSDKLIKMLQALAIIKSGESLQTVRCNKLVKHNLCKKFPVLLSLMTSACTRAERWLLCRLRPKSAAASSSSTHNKRPPPHTGPTGIIGSRRTPVRFGWLKHNEWQSLWTGIDQWFLPSIPTHGWVFSSLTKYRSTWLNYVLSLALDAVA